MNVSLFLSSLFHLSGSFLLSYRYVRTYKRHLKAMYGKKASFHTLYSETDMRETPTLVICVEENPVTCGSIYRVLHAQVKTFKPEHYGKVEVFVSPHKPFGS